jgi:hypothetical protein
MIPIHHRTRFLPQGHWAGWADTRHSGWDERVLAVVETYRPDRMTIRLSTGWITQHQFVYTEEWDHETGLPEGGSEVTEGYDSIPVLLEADPELEALLAEEERIEREQSEYALRAQMPQMSEIQAQQTAEDIQRISRGASDPVRFSHEAWHDNRFISSDEPFFEKTSVAQSMDRFHALFEVDEGD